MPTPAVLPYNIPQKIGDESVELVVASPKSKRCKIEQIDRLSNLSGKPERMVANWKKNIVCRKTGISHTPQPHLEDLDPTLLSYVSVPFFRLTCINVLLNNGLI